jgi:ABC-2 type transport system ATP-binding protein
LAPVVLSAQHGEPTHKMINVKNLIFEYPGHRALDHVTFHIKRNSVTALVGPNGAGKTTLMRCLCGLDRPLSGNIVVDSINVIEHPRKSHGRIGYLSDFFGLYDELSVRRCLIYAAQTNGATLDIAQSAEQTAERLNLSARLDQPVRELSRGLRQRVAIAQAIIHNPHVLILDEPASGLDPEARHDLAELFGLLQSAGMTLLISSHILAELSAYASDMLVIRGGRIIDQQTLNTSTSSARQVLIEVLHGARTAYDFLAAHESVHHVSADGNKFVCEITSDDQAQQQLLKDLVDKNASVVNFSTVQSDLQRSYLDSVKG